MERNKTTEKKNNPLYSETAYDAFRTIDGRCEDLVIPFVNHMFKENYGTGAVIRRLRNEHNVEHQDGSEDKRVMSWVEKYWIYLNLFYMIRAWQME